MLVTRRVLRGKAGKRAGQVVAILSHPFAFGSYVRAMRAARLRGTALASPLGNVKYLGQYLARRLTAEQRRQAILFHHDFLARGLRHDAWQPEKILWQRDRGGQLLDVCVRPAQLSPMEGEHELAFRANGRVLYTLTFVFSAAAVIGVASSYAMFIGGAQGMPFARSAIRAAAKANDEIAPVSMLMIVARALAQALDVPCIVGICSGQHPARDYAADKIALDYDRLWQELGGTILDNGWFVLHPVGDERPLAETPLSHRRRTRRKRERKRQFHAEVGEALQTCLAAVPRSRGDRNTPGLLCLI